jgi:glyoxylase-like metal-dependent hydrolase (beta-lactamase superfamily II)
MAEPASGDFRLHPIRLPHVNCYLYYRPGEALLVDCGNPGADEAILREMEKLGLAPADLKLLVLTHSHADHAGSARRLKELTSCQIAVHGAEADRLRMGSTPFPGGTRWKAKVLVALGRAFRSGMLNYPGVEPDLLVEGDSWLSAHGFPLQVLHCPGHTRGSMLVLTPEGELLSGDSFFGLEGKLHFPPFAEDVPRLLESWERLRDLDPPPHTIYPAHGHPFSWQRFLHEADTGLKRYARP